jgi:hypothetical protein
MVATVQEQLAISYKFHLETIAAYLGRKERGKIYHES